MTVEPDEFRSLLSRWASGVTIVSACDEAGQEHGMTVSAFGSVSMAPPLVQICVGHEATLHELLSRAQFIGISILSSEQREISRHFAAHDVHGWTGVPRVTGRLGVPLAVGAIATLECRVTARYEAGDHTLMIAEVVHGTTGEADPLVYFRGNYTALQR